MSGAVVIMGMLLQWLKGIRISWSSAFTSATICRTFKDKVNLAKVFCEFAHWNSETRMTFSEGESAEG